MRTTHRQSIVDENVFRFVLGLEIQKASRLRYSFSVVCLSPDSPLDELDRTAVAEASLATLRGTDIAAVLPNSSIALLLVDADISTLQGIVDRATRSISEAILKTLGTIRRLSVSAGGSSYPQTGSTEDELIQQARTLMMRARGQGGDRLCLPA